MERHAGVVSAIAERLEQQQPPRALDALRPEDVTAHLQKTGIGTKAAKESVTSLRRFVRFLDETGQMAPNDAMVLSEFLRGPG